CTALSANLYHLVLHSFPTRRSSDLRGPGPSREDRRAPFRGHIAGGMRGLYIPMPGGIPPIPPMPPMPPPCPCSPPPGGGGGDFLEAITSSIRRIMPATSAAESIS